MKRVAIVSLMGLLFAAGSAMGQESEANRKDKTAYVAFEAIGFTLMPVSGFRAGYFISPDLTAEVGYATGGAKVLDFEADKTVIEAKAKYFLGNSFYVDGGLAQESWKVKYDVLTSTSGTTTATEHATVTNTGVSLHLGNQWQWDGFTLGCDWLGYFLSLNTKSSFKSDGSVDKADKDDQEKSIKDTMGGSSAHLVRFYLGWAF